MSNAYTETMNKLIEELGRLPGIGPKSAERLAFHILMAPSAEALALADAIRDVKTKTRRCQGCYSFSQEPLCPICSDPRRDKTIICVIEQPKDLIALEKTGACKWVYHVLGGHIAPLDGIEPSDLTIDQLVKRIHSDQVNELVMATNPNIEGDGTALYISSLLRDTGVRITRLARGLPTGSTIEYASGKILTDAILGRQELP